MKGDDIADRLLGFASAVLGIVGGLPRGGVGRHLAGQLTRCATSGGANYEEARAAESAADFAHKAAVAAKEVSEAVYWLRLAGQGGLCRDARLADMIEEGRQLVAILRSSARTARARATG